MPAFDFDGHRVHYRTAGGDGPLVVFQHGLLQSGQDWFDYGYVSALGDRFRVAAPDSLGHGDSDDPRDREHCSRGSRADLICALADELQAERFHYVGYSMGGWIGGALAGSHRERLLSVSIGGWDVAGGYRTAQEWARRTFDVELTVDLLMQIAGAVMPGVAEASDRRRDWWRATGEELERGSDDTRAVAGSGVPLHLWCGQLDSYFDPARRLAEQHGVPFDPLPGDHFSAFAGEGAAGAVARFLAGVA